MPGKQSYCRDSAIHPCASQPRLFGTVALVEHLVSLDYSELDKQLADPSFVKAFAESRGIGLEGELSVRACTNLLRHRIGVIKNCHEPASNNPAPIARTATPDPILRPEETTEHSVSSGLDEYDLIYEGSTTSSEVNFGKIYQQTPAFLRRDSQIYPENASDMSTQATQTPQAAQAPQAIRGTSPGHSVGSWTFIESPSPQATIEGDTAVRVSQAETEEQGEHASALSEFDLHPGHKIWVWDIDKQRWRMRGRSGQKETDWFPESFA